MSVVLSHLDQFAFLNIYIVKAHLQRKEELEAERLAAEKKKRSHFDILPKISTFVLQKNIKAGVRVPKHFNFNK